MKLQSLKKFKTTKDMFYKQSDFFCKLTRPIMGLREPCPLVYKPPHDKTNEMTCAPSEDSDQPEHPPGLIRVFAVRMKKPWVLGYSWSAQADLSFRLAHRSFCWFCFVVAPIH